MSEINEKDLNETETPDSPEIPTEDTVETEQISADEIKTTADQSTYNANPFAQAGGTYTGSMYGMGTPYGVNGGATFTASGAYTSEPMSEEALLMQENEKKSQKAGKASFVWGLISLIISVVCCIGCCMPLPIVFSIISLVKAGKAKKLAANKKRNGLALAGFICAIIGLVLAVIALIVWIIYIIYVYNNLEYFEHLLNEEALKQGIEFEFDLT